MDVWGRIIMKGAAVVNRRKSSFDVYIGRPSKWGNPFEIGKDGTREEVIKKFEADFRKRLGDNPQLITDLLLLNGKILGCYCAPKPCHGDVLVKLIAEFSNNHGGVPDV